MLSRTRPLLRLFAHNVQLPKIGPSRLRFPLNSSKSIQSSNFCTIVTQSGLPVAEDVPSETEFTLQLTDDEMRELTNNLDEELVKKVKYIQLEHEVYKQEGYKVPQNIKMHRWKDLLLMESRSQRKRLYEFLWLNEIKSQNEKKKKELARQEQLEKFGPKQPRPDDPTGMLYGLNLNTLFLRLYDSKINFYHHHKVVSAMIHSSPIILDCGYDEFMTVREASNCASQMELMINENRIHKDPFNLVLCNADPKTKLMEHLNRRIPVLHNDDYPLVVNEQSYLDLYPREKLVYLSPHARDEMQTYSEDNIYIIGGMVDKSDPRPFSLAKAKKEGIRMMKFPLDKHLDWGTGHKSLTLNQVMGIMLDLRASGGNWSRAFEHIPKRKLRRDFETSSPTNPNVTTTVGRKERPSSVFEDYELLKSSRKGFFPKKQR